LIRSLVQGRSLGWSLGGSGAIGGLAGHWSGRLLRLGELAVELLAKLPHWLRRQGIDAAWNVIEFAMCHAPALRRVSCCLSLVQGNSDHKASGDDTGARWICRWPSQKTRRGAAFLDVDSFTGFLDAEMRGKPPPASAGGGDKEIGHLIDDRRRTQDSPPMAESRVKKPQV
jgi:hypothetical protein